MWVNCNLLLIRKNIVYVCRWSCSSKWHEMELRKFSPFVSFSCSNNCNKEIPSYFSITDSVDWLDFWWVISSRQYLIFDVQVEKRWKSKKTSTNKCTSSSSLINLTCTTHDLYNSPFLCCKCCKLPFHFS